MRAWCYISLVLLALLSVGCGSMGRVELGQLTLSDVEYAEGDSASTAIPQRLTLLAEVENQGGAIKVAKCRIALYYKWRKMAIIDLEQGVKIAARGGSEVLLPMHVAVVRNSQTMPMQKALERGELANIQISWEASVRRSLLRKRVERSAEPIEQVLSEQALEQIRGIFMNR